MSTQGLPGVSLLWQCNIKTVPMPQNFVEKIPGHIIVKLR